MKIYKLALAVLALLIVGISMAGAFYSEINACNNPGCHVNPPTSINVTANVTSTLTVSPAQSFTVNITWTGGSTTDSTVAKWPTVFTTLGIVRNNSLFSPNPIMSPNGVNPKNSSLFGLTAPGTPGNHILRVYAATGTGGNIADHETDFKDINVTVQATQPALSMTSNPTTVTVGLTTNVLFNVTSSGVAVQGATVNLSGNATGSGTTAANGSVTINVTATAAGAIIANASKTGYTSATATVTATAAAQPALSMTSNPTTVTVGLPTNVIFNVTSSGVAVQGAIVNLSGNATGSGTTAANGSVTINVTATAAGAIIANASKTGYTSGTTTVTATATAQTPLSVSANPTTVTVSIPTNVIFNVTNSSGVAVQGATVNLSGNATGSGTTAANGSVTINVTATAAGAIIANASKTGYTNATTTVTANAPIIIADRIINLNTGWNLISIPNFAAQNSVAQVLANVQYNAIWEFDPATGNFKVPSVLNPLNGYWINVTAPNQSIGFIAAGTVIPSTPPIRNLYEGWNLIGVAVSHNDDTTLNASVVFAGLKNGQVGPLYSMLVNYEDMANPHTSIVGSDLTDTTKLNQGQGYWLFINPLVNYPRNNVLWAGKVW